MIKRFVVHIMLILFALLIPLNIPVGASSVMIESGDQQLRENLQWLNDHGIIVLSTSSWPVSYDAVQKALDSAKTNDANRNDIQLLKKVKQELSQRYRSSSVEVSATLATKQLALGGFGNQSREESKQSIALASETTLGAGTLKLNHLLDPVTSKQSNVDLSGSYIATSFAGQILYAGQLSHWWGPGRDGSLQWSSAATPLIGVGLKRGTENAPENRYLSFVGPWSYEVFLGRLLHDEAAPGVRMFGLRITAQPITGLEVGVSRMFEWGGRGADAGISSFTDSLLGKGNNESTGGAVSNEVAGFDLIYTSHLLGNPLSLYFQYTGEDEAGKLPSQYIGLLGVRYQSRIDDTRLIWSFEAADTESKRLFGFGTGRESVAYRHDTFYHDGFYHDGLPIAHYLGGDGKSSAATLVVAPVDAANNLRYSVRVEHASVNESSQLINLLYPVSDKISQLEGAVSGQSYLFQHDTRWSVGLTARHSQNDGNNLGLSASVAVRF